MSDEKNNDNVIQLPTKKPDAENNNNDSSGDVSGVLNFEDSIRLRQEKEIKKLEDDKVELEAQLTDLRKKLGVMVSVNEMLKIQLQDLITQLSFMDQHIKITTQNARNMLVKLPKIGNLDIPLKDD